MRRWLAVGDWRSGAARGGVLALAPAELHPPTQSLPLLAAGSSPPPPRCTAAVSHLSLTHAPPPNPLTPLQVDFKQEGEWPTYGNDDDRVDGIARDLVAAFHDKLAAQHTYRASVRLGGRGGGRRRAGQGRAGRPGACVAGGEQRSGGLESS